MPLYIYVRSYTFKLKGDIGPQTGTSGDRAKPPGIEVFYSPKSSISCKVKIEMDTSLIGIHWDDAYAQPAKHIKDNYCFL